MKKLMILILITLSMSIFAVNLQRIEDVQQKLDSKGWCDYSGTPNDLFDEPGERAMYYNVEDFGFEYPVDFLAVHAFIYEGGVNYHFKIYDKDGITVLWESADSLSVEISWEMTKPDTNITLTDDFWIALVPQADGSPTTVVDDADGPWGAAVSNSYYGTSGEWISLSDFYGENRNHSMLVYIEPSLTPPPPPPLLREVSGLESFMDADANIFIRVMSQASIVIPVVGEYSIEGGAWTSFDLSFSKDSHYLNGSIPAQADGTIGSVKFNFVDTLGNSSISDEFPLSWSKDNMVLDESFEGEWLPSGWSLNSVGAGFINTSIAAGQFAHDGVKSAGHMDNENPQDDWLITPILSIPATNSCVLTFWQNGEWLEFHNFHEVSVTVVGSGTWTQIYTGQIEFTPDARPGELGVWEQIMISLIDYVGDDIQIGFHYTGDFSDRWYIDEVKVTYDYEAPEIVKLEGNPALVDSLGIGGFVNNDLVLTVTAYDLSGVQSIIGHYSIDGGAVIDLPFVATKSGNEIWIASIPAESVPITGVINFDMIDLGGTASPTTADYDFEFILDEEPPIIKNFEYGKPVFINNDMNLVLTFTDESSISTCTGSYTDGSGTIPIVMTPSKVNQYLYVGTIPAKVDETFGSVTFSITDSNGLVINSIDYDVEWFNGSQLFSDDFEADHNPADWTFDGSWVLTEEDAHSATHSLTESEGGDYPQGSVLNFSATINTVMDFSSTLSVSLYLWKKIDTEPNYDYVYVEGTVDGGTTWIELDKFHGYGGEWEADEVSLGAFAGEAAVQIRFRWFCDDNTGADGAWLDDIKICQYQNDWNYTDIDYDGPEFYVFGIEDFTFEAILTDISDISETKVIYTVDGGAEQEALATPSSGPSGTYSYTIPAQTPGSKIDFRISATDASINLNYTETGTYEIIFGYYLYYENGTEYINYLDPIGPSGEHLAVAKRLTMGPLDTLATKNHYMAHLVGFTIDNYISLPDYPSAPMYIHVWENSGNGPGKDIITPFLQDQASVPGDSYAITYVDLRPYSAQLSDVEGDIYVGFTSAGDQTCILYENSAYHSFDGIRFERSWLASGPDMDNITWELELYNIYHMNGITGDYALIDTPMAPLNLTWRHDGMDKFIFEWDRSIDSDINHYNVYRGNVSGFTLETPIGTVSDSLETTYVEYIFSSELYYKVTAVDKGGQESLPSNEIYLGGGIEDENIPLTTSLSQNYPNPFNPKTIINFSTAVEGNVNLIIYNTAGAVVAKLVDGKMNRGYHNVAFDASNLNSGVYYYTLEVNGVKVTTKRMIMIK